MQSITCHAPSIPCLTPSVLAVAACPHLPSPDPARQAVGSLFFTMYVTKYLQKRFINRRRTHLHAHSPALIGSFLTLC